MLGCIADDFTGGTDLSGNLAQRGFRVIQTIGVPAAGFDASGADAVVVALKSRTVPAAQARAWSREALRWLQAAGGRQFYFKYCSTFDSTAAGNIGPVIDELLEALPAPFTIACPAFPDGGRTVYQGHLFVHGALLNESGMQHHPLTPMTDPNLVRVLSAQTPSKVGLIPFATVESGAAAIREAIERLKTSGVRIAIADAVSNSQLRALGAAVSDLPLVTGGSGLALGLNPPAAADPAGRMRLKFPTGRQAILAGSCSQATLQQVKHAQGAYPTRKLDARLLQKDPVGTLQDILAWVRLQGEKPVLIYSSGDPAEIAAIHAAVGGQQAGTIIEEALGRIAQRLVESGVRQLIVAGGETSGAVVKALGVTALRIGAEICPGVCWTETIGSPTPLALALKSGNFGAREFMTDAWRTLDEN